MILKVDVPSEISFKNESFDILVEVKNVGTTSLQDIAVNFDTTVDQQGGRRFDQLLPDESERFTVTIPLDYCQRNIIPPKSGGIGFTVTAQSSNIVKEESLLIPFEDKLFTISSNIDKIENTLNICFYINKKDRKKEDQLEIEFGLHKGTSAVLLDFIVPLQVDDKLQVVTKSYKLPIGTPSGELNLQGSLYGSGLLFSNIYKLDDDINILED